MNSDRKKNFNLIQSIRLLKEIFHYRIVRKLIYKNLFFYNLAIFFTRHTNFLLPHEEDIYGLNLLKLEKKGDIIDVGASYGLYYKSIRSII